MQFRKLAINSLQVVTANLEPKFYRETLHRPWMRVKIFLDHGPLSRTPEHYKKFFYEWKVEIPSPVHYTPESGNWKKLEDGRIVPVQNIPIGLLYPDELHQGIWGGEAVIRGLQKRKPKRRPVAQYWVPELKETVVYSEILDKHFKVTVTSRAQKLIDQHYGLDSYFMKTKPADLMSELCLKLKREMLYGLLHETIYPDDSVKRKEIYDKYKQYIIPEEEIEWFGLNLREAYRKQSKIEEESERIGPYKDIFRKEFIEHLKNKQETDEAVNEEMTVVEKLKNLSIFSSK